MNKLVDENNKTYERSFSKKPIDADCSVLLKESETNPNAPKFKGGKGSKLISTKTLLVKVTQKIGKNKDLLLVL